MPLVTGNLRDITNNPMRDMEAEILFSLNKPNTAGGGLYPTAPTVVVPAANGDFSVNLASTQDMVDIGWYRLQIRYLSSDGVPVTITDYPDWRISVPSTDVVISSLIASANRAPENHRLVYVSMTRPTNVPDGVYWLRQNPDNTEEGSGDLFQKMGRSWNEANGDAGFVPITNLRGPAGHNAIGADETIDTLAGYVNSTGSNTFKTAVYNSVDGRMTEALETPASRLSTSLTQKVDERIGPTLNETASVDDLTASIFMPCWRGGATESTVDYAVSVWVAPFKCRIISADIVWDTMSLAASSTNYITFYLRKRNNVAITQFAEKNTTSASGQGIVARETWSFDNGLWSSDADKTLAKGEQLVLQWSPNGTATVGFPLAMTWRYVPV